ncbi:hypothetical protein EYR40_004210 [Pleurotus pulmonarius]|nr:hypothetical protein EYR40_004210 [Pleurotus pulmonarius]KAF4606915.1 hypothetical protein EYR38_000970 [Pleurotus pulmonarius]
MAEETQDTPEISDAPQTSDITLPEPSVLLYVDHLRPPIGTSYFKRDTVTLLDNVAIQKDGQTYANISWSFNYYLYVTGARPDDPDFPKRGQVYVVFVHTGSIDVKRSRFDTLSLTLATTSEHCTANSQLPETGSGEQVGTSKDYKYLMDFDQTMNMFKNNGNQVMDPPFEARYQRDFIAKDSKQRGITREKSVEFGASNGWFYDQSVPIYGFSVFQSDSVSDVPYQFTGSATISEGSSTKYSTPDPQATLSIDLKFDS